MSKLKNRQQMIDALDKLDLASETFCVAPYIATDLDQDGSVLSCYRGKTRLGNWKQQPFADSFNGEKMQKIRADLFDGVKNKNCRSCYMAEEKGSISPRMNFFFDWNDGGSYSQHLPDDFIDRVKKSPIVADVENIVTSEIRPSSLCNQRCMHCGPHSSTKWIETLAKEENYSLYKENKGLLANGEGPIDHMELTNKNIVAYYSGSISSKTEYKSEILKLLNDSAFVVFTGGEPLLTPEHIEYLNHFVNVTGKSVTKELEYSTNLNIKNLDQYFEYWEKFKTVSFRISIDSNFDSYEYFRTYGNTALLQENLNKLFAFKQRCDSNRTAHIKISASITFNMFSALRWKEIMRDWSRVGAKLHASLILDHPVSVKYLPRDLSTKALDDMQWCIDHVHDFITDEDAVPHFISHTTNCMNYIRGYNNKFNKFEEKVVKYIEFCDRTSGNNYYDYYPELKEYMHIDDNTRI